MAKTYLHQHLEVMLMLMTNDPDKVARLLAEPFYADALKTWQHLCRDAAERKIDVSLALVKKRYELPAGPERLERFEATYATREGEPLPVKAFFGMYGRLELYLHGERVMSKFATVDEGTQAVWLDRAFDHSGILDKVDAEAEQDGPRP